MFMYSEISKSWKTRNHFRFPRICKFNKAIIIRVFQKLSNFHDISIFNFFIKILFYFIFYLFKYCFKSIKIENKNLFFFDKNASYSDCSRAETGNIVNTIRLFNP